jgi:hypothetical protein
MQYLTPFAATAAASHFRSQGRHVLAVHDNLTTHYHTLLEYVDVADRLILSSTPLLRSGLLLSCTLPLTACRLSGDMPHARGVAGQEAILEASAQLSVARRGGSLSSLALFHLSTGVCLSAAVACASAA